MPRNLENLSTWERVEALLEDNVPTLTEKIITFVAGTTGAVGATTVFSVTGQIQVVNLLPFTTTLLAENGATATVSLGTAETVALFIAASEPEDFETGDFWTAVVPALKSIAIPAALKDIAVSEDIILTIANDTITSGVVEFYLRWIPLSSDAAVVAA